MGKNVAVFVDVANIFYAAKAAGVDIDYVTLLKASSAGRDLVRAYAYTGLDPDNENQRNFHDFLRRHGYKVVSKDIRKYGDGKVKANLDIELVVDMMKTARNLDIAIVISGDGDFAPAIRAVQEMGVRVEVVSFRGNTSSDLMDVADLFTDITQIAKVEKGSSRSGRRVADDDQDLSMTEVPDKQSEGTGERSRGRGRGRRVAEAVAPARRGRSAENGTGEVSLVVLPGEKLSRVGAARPAGESPVEATDDVEEVAPAVSADGTDAVEGEEARRRRRRRGGRGRGRGRREEGYAPAAAEAGSVPDDLDEERAEPVPPARRPASTFGSVWDSQIGIPASAGRSGPIVEDDDEDFEEPAVPEYLLAERRQRAGRGSGPAAGRGRGRGGAYAAALDRERFGGGRGSIPSRFAEPAPRGRDARGGQGGGDRRPFPQSPRPMPRPQSDEPWSEVPPEIEAMLRAQMGGSVQPAGDRGRRPVERPQATESREPAAPGGVGPEASEATEATPTAKRPPRPRAVRAETPAVETIGPETPTPADAEPPARRATRSRRTTGATETPAATEAAPAKPRATRSRVSASGAGVEKAAAPRASRSRSRAVPADDAAGGGPDATVRPTDAEATAGDAAPARRTTRRKAAPAE